MAAKPKDSTSKAIKSVVLTLLSMAALAAPVILGFSLFPTDPWILLGFLVLLFWMSNEFFFPAKHSREEVREFRSLLFMTFSQPGTVVVSCWGYFLLGPSLPGGWILSAVGLFLALFGAIFRFSAMRTLGQYYTMCVTIRDSHKLISNGPYRFVRHPGYLGQFCFLLGIVFTMQSIWGLFVYIIWAVTQIYRIQKEESVLVNFLGETYCEYQQKTKRLIPGVY
ncbi:methyltransferase family protein [Bdellovibrionota bacterium]